MLSLPTNHWTIFLEVNRNGLCKCYNRLLSIPVPIIANQFKVGDSLILSGDQRTVFPDLK